jgi:hypothetical protein
LQAPGQLRFDCPRTLQMPKIRWLALLTLGMPALAGFLTGWAVL